MTHKKHNPRTALCYIRQSFTRDADDTNSPERQRENIQAFCSQKGWIPEFYQDTGGHKSGRSEKNRPQWMALKKRLNDPDVVALVANDLSRLHRKGWRVGDLIENLNKYNVALALAAPGRQQIDTSTQQGRMFVQLGAMFDEYYAEDIAQRAKDSVAYRRAKGITIGKPPFGTSRNDDGHLIKSNEGAWLLPNGKFKAGQADRFPGEGAIWRSYAETTQQILELYATGDIGLEKLAYQLNELGFPFCDRKGRPRPVVRADIRRVIANWPEYGGIIMDKKAKDRPGYSQDMQALNFVESRAVFPIELLKNVATIRQARSIKPPDRGTKRTVKTYPLSVMVRCAHCEKLAQEDDNPKLRSPLNGYTTSTGKRRYRHRFGVSCGCKSRSVLCDQLEGDFERLIGLLQVKPEAIDLMTEMALKLEGVQSKDEVDFEQEKQTSITLCRRRIEAAVILFGEGRINRAEYRKRIEENEREIAYWETRSTETKKIALELTACVETIERISMLWKNGTEEDKQGITRHFFEYIIYDLDAQQIVDFRLKPWADQFIMLRAALYEQEGKSSGGHSITNMQKEEYHMPHRSLKSTPLPWVLKACFVLTRELHVTFAPLPPPTQGKYHKMNRNHKIKDMWQQGIPVTDIAQQFNISQTRVYQLLMKET